MAKRKQWSICQDSLEPLADELWLLASRFGVLCDFDALDQWNDEYRAIHKASLHSDHLLTGAQRARLAELSKLISAWKEPPSPRDVEMLYEKHRIDKVGEYLKAIISVDYAADFTLKLLSARKRFFALDFKACKILNGDDVGGGSTVSIRYAIPKLIDQYYGQLHAAFPGCEEQPTGDELPDHLRKMEVEILDEYSGVACEFHDVSKYLKAVAAIVREKARPPEAATLPEDHKAPINRKRGRAGESDARTKIVAALSTHHNFDKNGRDLDQTPIICTEFAILAEVSRWTLWLFFKNYFGGYAAYKKACRERPTLLASLRTLRGESSLRGGLGSQDCLVKDTASTDDE